MCIFIAMQGGNVIAEKEGRNRLQLRLFTEETAKRNLAGDVIIWHFNGSAAPRVVAIVYDKNSGFEPLLLFTSPPINATMKPSMPELVKSKG